MVVIERAPDGSASEPPASYWDRRVEIASVAAGIDRDPVDIVYRQGEHDTWARVSEALAPQWERYAATGLLAARDRLGLPADHVPQLGWVDRRLRGITGFRYRAVDGILSAPEFFAALADRVFPSTQYLRWEGAPGYTPEPDVVHEVIGHANCLACPELAELHRLAGDAVGRVETPESVQALADVFWFTVEFGVVRERGDVKAVGAGLLSSPGELGWFSDHAEVRELDVAGMIATPYDIHRYQPVVFAARSLAHLLEVVGGFFDSVSDGRLLELRAASVTC